MTVKRAMAKRNTLEVNLQSLERLLHRFDGYEEIRLQSVSFFLMFFAPRTKRKRLCSEFPPCPHTFVEEFLEAVSALAQDGPDLLLLEGTSSDL